jgi:hypothetical protein
VTPETPAAIDLWHRTLAQIPTLFGRLTYLASLRNANANSYQHHGLAARFGSRAAQSAIRESHLELLRNWLELPLATRKADLASYLAMLDTPRHEVLDNWKNLRPYSQCVPLHALKPERELFLGDLEVLLEILRRESGAAAIDPGVRQFPPLGR